MALRFSALTVRHWLLTGSLFCLTACGDSSPTGPNAVAGDPLRETTFVVLVNVLNSINSAGVPTPGSARTGVRVAVVDGPSATTDDSGIVVLGPVAAGARTLSITGSGQSGQVSVNIGPQELREVAVALNLNSAAIMANVPYEFATRLVQVTPSMSIDQVNAALADSSVIVLFRTGTYTGDLVLAGSRFTLYGEGPRGGTVVINGNVIVRGSSSRIRGARISGRLDVPASGFGMSFRRIRGPVEISGSGSVLLNNVFCSNVAATGSNVTALGNAGTAPLPAPPDC